MTPKEKERDLIIKFAFKGAQHEGEAKTFALIAVNEIIEELYENADGEVKSMRIIYWKKVNQEINKL
jgi:hypothetical protein